VSEPPLDEPEEQLSLALLCCYRSWHADGVTFHLISLGHTWASLPRKGNKINAELTVPS